MHYLSQAHIPRRHTPVNRPSGSAILAITLLHGLVFYGLVTSLRSVFVEKIPGPFVAYFLPREEPREIPPPPPLEVESLPPVPVPTDTVVELVIVPEETNAIAIPPILPPPADPPQTIQPSVVTPAIAIANTLTIPEYPLISRRLAEAGTARLSLTIAEDGTVSDVSILKSTGFPRLDVAAVEWIKRHWRYRPAMKAGMPVKSTIEKLVTFTLH